MQCPQCHTECPEGAKFCLECGEKLVEVCRDCGVPLPLGARFCLQCGAKIAVADTLQLGGSKAMTQAIQRLIPKGFAERLLATRGQVSHERRLVTILFSDVTGSTAMGEPLDPEELLEIMSGAFEFLIQPIYHYEGTLARLMGDAVLAFFGAPIAHEDDPERAIRAGLEITAEAAEYAEKLDKERGIAEFNVRVGINTGLVVVGEVGSDLRVEYTAMGDAVNLAARLEQAAPPGGVLIGHDTYRHVRGVFDVLPQEPLVVKGKTDAVLTYLVQSAKPRAFRVEMRGVEGIETRMIGREVELLALQRSFEDVIEDSETRVVTVVGEAGVGKTRLLDEFFNWAELRPERFYYFKGRAASTTQAVPYQLWRDLFAYRFEILESDSAAKAVAKFRVGMAGVLESERADLVGQLVGFDFAAAGSEAVQALSGSPNFGQLARAYLVQYFRGMVARQPAVVLLEDLQWADDSSLDLVAHLVGEVAAAPLLIVVAARPALFERRPNWGEGQEAYSRLELKALSKRATRGLVEEILQRVEDLPTSLRDLVVEGAEGNPYYVEELVKMLIEDGVIERREPHWRVEVERLGQVRVPPTLTAVLQARLDALPGGEKAVLQRASVVGPQFWDSVVDELAMDADEGLEVQPLLGALRERELVYRREQSTFAEVKEYTFKHTILRDVTYETVLLKLRRRYHGQVAAWLEAHAGERLGEYLGVIAGHYELAREWVKAAQYLRRSGQEAHRTNAYADARQAFERALKLLPDAPGAERALLTVRLGQVLLPPGQYGRAAQHLQAGLALARELGERATEVEALNSLGQLASRQGDWEAAGLYLQEGLALARDCGDTAGQAQAAQQLARTAWLRAQYAEAERWAQQSQHLYEQTGDKHGLMAARNELGLVAEHRGVLEQARGYFAANLALAREIGDRVREAQALNNLGELAREEGANEEARGLYDRFRQIMEAIGYRGGVALGLLNLGIVSIALGQDGAAWEYLRRALPEHMAMKDAPHALGDLVHVAHLQARAGQAERAAEMLGLALKHPASYSEVQRDAQPVMETLRKALGAEQLEAALARGVKLDLEQVVKEILAA